MSTPDTTSFILMTIITTIPPITTTYSTTFLVESVAGPSTSIWTTSRLWSTTFSASTVTSVTTIPNINLIGFSTGSAVSSTGSAVSSTGSGSSSTGSSTFITSITSSNTARATPTSSSTPIDSTIPLPSGVTVVPKPSSSKTTAIIVGILVPLGIICIIAMVLILRKKRKDGARAAGSFTIKHWFDKADDESPKPAIAPPGAELEAERGSYRVASPPRPRRPSSIPESVLNVMSLSSGPESNAADASSERSQIPIELAHLRSPTSLSNGETSIFIPNPDITPVYDGTRKKYLRTALEHNMPLARLTRPSLRVPNAPRPTQQNAGGIRRSSYFPEPLKIHKRSASDAYAPSARGRFVTNLEEDEHKYPSPVPTQQEFITNVRRGLSKTPPLGRAATDHVDFMADASSEEGSFAKDNEIAQKRQESLATLEGRTPASSSSNWDAGQGRAEFRNAFAPRNPPCVRGPIPEERMAARRKGNVIDEGVVNEWV